MRRIVLLVALLSLFGGCSATAPATTVVETAPPPLATRAASEPPVIPTSFPVQTPPIVVLAAPGDADSAGFDSLVLALRALPDVTVVFTEDEGELPDVVVVGIRTGTNAGPSSLVAAAADAARRGLPAIAVAAGGNSSSDFAVAARLAAEEVDDHRADFGSGTNLDQVVVNLNIPSCAPGTMVRGVVEVPVASDPPAGSGAPTFDCGSTMIEYENDLTALAVGFASRTLIPVVG